MPPGPQYRDGSSLRQALVIMVPAYLALNAVSMLFSWMNYQEMSRFVASGNVSDLPGFSPAALIATITSWLGTGLGVALAIVFGLWVARAYNNAVALTGPLRSGVGWTVGSWYIPVIGGFLAAGPMARLWERGPGGPKGRPMAWAILFALHQVATVVGFIVLFFLLFQAVIGTAIEHAGDPSYEPEDDPEFFSAFFGDFGNRFVLLSAGLLAVYVVTGAFMLATVNAIHQAQQQAAARLAPGRPMMGPPSAPPWR